MNYHKAFIGCALLLQATFIHALRAETGLSVGAAAVALEADDAMVIGGSIHAGYLKGQEGELRATAVVLRQADQGTVAIVACDILMIRRDLLDPVVDEIERKLNIPASNVLINATHTHHAPSTCTVHGYERDEVFCKRVQRGIVEAVTLAHARLGTNADDRFLFRLGQEASVGMNSRLLLSDNTIFWTGPREDVVRPTGPFDPDLPVLAFRGPDSGLKALIFNHSTHTIGKRESGKRSPSFYGLAAQELEAEHGGTVCFLEGASGSTHNLGLTCDEMVVRIKAAVNDALPKAQPRPALPLKAIKRPFTFKVRHFDEDAEEKAVSDYCHKRIASGAESVIQVFRDQREVLRPQQGQQRETWIQAMRIGDVVWVGVPAEFFTVLGIEIKRQSPFRYTYIAELANDWIGYLPDREAHALGGYQTWTGLHSYAEPGTGERMVDAVVELLGELQQLP